MIDKNDIILWRWLFCVLSGLAIIVAGCATMPQPKQVSIELRSSDGSVTRIPLESPKSNPEVTKIAERIKELDNRLTSWEKSLGNVDLDTAKKLRNLLLEKRDAAIHDLDLAYRIADRTSAGSLDEPLLSSAEQNIDAARIIVQSNPRDYQETKEKVALRPGKEEPVIGFWNTWFETVDDGKCAKELEKGKRYSFVLDISRFAYFKYSSAPVDRSVEDAVSKARELNKPTILFTIRPILDKNLVFSDNNRLSEKLSERVLQADINKLLKPTDKDVEERIKRNYIDFLAGRIDLREFASKGQSGEPAGEVRFQVQPIELGAATISITVWDESGMIPLDLLTFTVSIIDPKAQAVRPGPTSKTISLKAGLSTLLDVSSEFSSTGPLIADAAFYIFEPGPNGKSMILFAASKPKPDTAVPDQERSVSVYAWETEYLLSQYVEDRNQFLVKINQARLLAQDKKTQEYSYQEAAGELREMIFTAIDEEQGKQAAESERIFRDLVGRKDQSSVVFVRMRNKNGDPVYFPLGILAARSKSPFLDKRIIVVQPLPRENYPGGVHPVETWTFGVPQELEGVDENGLFGLALKNLKLPDPGPPFLYRDIPNIKGFLETHKPSAPEAKPEGILLLAHHAAGSLWFTNVGNRIVSTEIKHTFPSGSVAILSACSVAAAEGNNQAILKKLNDNGIDAMIVSPFPVEVNYGAMLAIHFVEALEEAKASYKGLTEEAKASYKGVTLAELFDKSAKKTAEYFKAMNINYEEMALEFVIAGDYRISVAPK